MSADQFITEHLDLWTEAVTTKSTSGRGSNGKVEFAGIQKLRELILELAVRGKLVPQDSDEEPASDLLHKIVSQTTRSAKTNAAGLPDAISAEEIPYDKPRGWEWSRLGAVSSYIQRGKGPKYADNGAVRVVSQKCIQWTGLDLSRSKFIADQSLNSYKPERFLKNRDILWNSTGTGTVGRLTCVSNLENPAIVADSHVTIIRLNLLNERFICAYLSSPTIQNRIDPHHPTSLVSGTTKQVELNTSSVKSLVAPIPSLAEQHRIVQKVDELMALCDRLEQQTRDQHAAHETLVDALLDTLTQSKDADELADNWARLAAHFDTLFTTEHSVDRLQDTIKQLAVMGKLVPQKNSDGDAAKLIENIRLDKEHLANLGQTNISKELPKPSADEMPFETPSNWVWCRLEELTYHSESGWSPACKSTPRTGDNWGVLKVSAVSWGVFQPQENKELPPNLASKPKLEVKAGDFLISRANTADLVARSVIAPEKTPSKLMMSDKIVRFSFSPEITPEYVNLFNNSPAARVYYAQIAGGTSSSMKNVSRHQIQMLCLPLPPTGEQSRIVRRVNQLVAICDQLKARLNQAGDTRRQMADAVVEQTIH